MSKLFNPDSPVMQTLSRIADLVVLNVFCLICCIPIVTIGAAVTALYDAVGRMQRDEGSIYKAYFKAFASNFKQATVQWLLLAVCLILLTLSLMFYLNTTWSAGKVLLLLTVIMMMIWAAVTAWIFPLQSRFYNTVRGTVQNAMICALAYFPRTLVMVVLNVLPWALLLAVPTLFLQVSIVFLMIWFALVAHWNLKLLAKPMQKLIDQSNAAAATAEAE